MHRSKFIVYIVAAHLQLFVFAKTCDDIITASTGLGDGIYYSSWYTTTASKEGQSLARSFMIFLIRAQRPCTFSGGGFFPVTLNTFKSVCNLFI